MVKDVRHKEIESTIRGQICKIYKEIVNLVKSLNEFMIEKRRPFETYSSCQESRELSGSIGGKAIIEMKQFQKTHDDIDIMGKILKDAGNRMFRGSKGKSLESGSDCSMTLDLQYWPSYETYTPILTIDCSLYSRTGARNIFEKRRKETFNSIRGSLKKFSQI